MTEAVGVAAALQPRAWLGLFGDDPVMIATGTRYLQIVGPFYGAFGAGLALYFASQGAGRVGWPLLAGLVRVAVAIGGGWIALNVAGGLDGVYWALGIGLLIVGVVNAAAVAMGAWFTSPAQPRPGRVAAPAE